MTLLWRMGLRFETAEQAKTAYAQLDADRELEPLGASLSLVGPTLYAYAPTRSSFESAAHVLRPRLRALSIPPERVVLDKWIGGRWSLDHREPDAEPFSVGDSLVSVFNAVRYLRPD